MDGKGVGSSLCIMFGSAPSCPSFLVATFCMVGGGFKKRVEVSNADLTYLVGYAKAEVSAFRFLFYPLRVEFLFEHKVGVLVFKIYFYNLFGTYLYLILDVCCSLMWGIVVLIESEGTSIIIDVCPETNAPECRVEYFENEETFMDGNWSSTLSSLYWMYSSIGPPILFGSGVLKRNYSGIDRVLETDPGTFDGFVVPLSESEDHIS
ncbi:hypothetical protein Tco_0870207 [Tanacetum coccineum]